MRQGPLNTRVTSRSVNKGFSSGGSYAIRRSDINTFSHFLYTSPNVKKKKSLSHFTKRITLHFESPNY